MAGLPWYCIWSEFSRHGKTRDLCARVKDRNAGMYVLRLFEHCAEHALDGRIAAHIVEDVADWRGKDGVLLAALEASKILDVEGDMRVVHGWTERNGARIQKWLRDAQKPRGNKDESPADPSPVPHGISAGPAGDSEGVPHGNSAGIPIQRSRKRRSSVSDQPAVTEQPPVGGLAGDRRLLVFREELGRALGLPGPVAIGSDADAVVTFIQSQREAVGDETLLSDCIALAKKSQTGTPASLAWFVGWLKNLPVPTQGKGAA